MSTKMKMMVNRIGPQTVTVNRIGPRSGQTLESAMSNFKPATHVLYKSDFNDENFWSWLLEAHGIETSDEDGIDYEEITIRATVETVQ